jgi:hypothetical protein
MISRKTVAATAAVVGIAVASALAQSPAANMSFFVTSSNPKGGNLGGLAGADQVCQGELIAQNVADLHAADKNKISGTTALTEKGTLPNYLKMVDGKPAPAAQPLQHDILTGTNEDGTKNADTCNNWTVGDASAKAMLGHADRMGRNPGLNSWNAIHASQGCGQEQLQPTGGAGMLYCFASN